jgi:prolyl oligopeptidase
MLFVTAESDTRVDPMHARKMTARMQKAQSANAHRRPILLRAESKAGHGAGKPVSKLADELADQLSFLLDALGAGGPSSEARSGPASFSARRQACAS